MDKIEFKSWFETGYSVLEFQANKERTYVTVESSFSVPTSKINSKITNLRGETFEDKGWFFTDVRTLDSSINEDTNITLDSYDVGDPDNFNEEDFINHLKKTINDNKNNFQNSTILYDLTIM